MATQATAHDFTPGQAVTISRRVLHQTAGQQGTIVRVDTENNEVSVRTLEGEGPYSFWAGWVIPAVTALAFNESDIGRWVHRVGDYGKTSPVTFVGFTKNGHAQYIEGHVDLRITDPSNIRIIN